MAEILSIGKTVVVSKLVELRNDCVAYISNVCQERCQLVLTQCQNCRCILAILALNMVITKYQVLYQSHSGATRPISKCSKQADVATFVVEFEPPVAKRGL